jgi:hypothetical protein
VSLVPVENTFSLSLDDYPGLAPLSMLPQRKAFGKGSGQLCPLPSLATAITARSVTSAIATEAVPQLKMSRILLEKINTLSTWPRASYSSLFRDKIIST